MIQLFCNFLRVKETNFIIDRVKLFCYSKKNNTYCAFVCKFKNKSTGLVFSELAFYNIVNGTRRASDRKVKQAGLFLGVVKKNIEILVELLYSMFNSTRQAKATAGLFFGGNLGRI